MEDIRIEPEEVHRRWDRGEKLFFVDARSEDSWNSSDTRLPGAARVPADDAERHVNGFPGDALIVTYCT